MKRQVAVVLVALLMVGAVVPTAVATGSSGITAERHGPSDGAAADEPKVADKAYIKENGDAVLVYENTESESDDSFGTESESTATGEFGVDVSAGLADVLIQDEVSSNVTGEGVAVLTPNRLEGNGSMAAPQPDVLESMTFDFTSETSSDTQSVDASLESTISTEGSERAGYLGLLENAQTSGTMTVTPDTFTLDGQGSAELAIPYGKEMEQTFTIEETDDGFTVTAKQLKSVSSYSEENWNSREAARQTLERRYVGAAKALGGDAELTIDSYSYDAGGEGESGTLDIAYTVEYTGIEEGVSKRLVDSLTSSEQYDIDKPEAKEIARDIRNVEFTRVHGSFTSKSGSYNVEFDSEIGNYTAGANAALRLQAASEFGSEKQVERLRKKIAARQASNLKQTTKWSASVEPQDDDTVDISASLTTSSKNWGSYVSQLKQRDIDLGTTKLEAHVETDGDEISGTMSFTAKREGLVKKAIKPYLEALKDSETQSTEKTKAFVTALRDSEFRKAKMNVSADGEQVKARAAVAADNMSAIQPLLADTYGGTVTSMYGNTSDDGKTTTTYVQVTGLTGEDPSESDVRDTDVVNAETEVAMPGTWDREFPSLDTDSTRDYLGIEGDGGSGTGGLAPGFGALAAALAIAIVAATLVARRRE